MLTLLAVGAVLLLVLFVSLPLLVDLGLVVLQAAGVRVSDNTIVAVYPWLNRISDRAEYGVVAMTVGLVLVPIYLHVAEFAPFWASTFGGLSNSGDAETLSDLLEHEGLFHLMLAHVLPSLWINFNLLYHYYRACTIAPGTPPPSSPPSDPQLARRYCAQCRVQKDEHTHHCSTCGRCVYRMDHHCMFTANCVGAANHAHFLLFVLYGWTATAYAVLLCIHPYQHCYDAFDSPSELAATVASDGAQGGSSVPTLSADHPCSNWSPHKLRLLYVALAAFVTLSVFAAFVLYTIARGTTTFAMLSGSRRPSTSHSRIYSHRTSLVTGLVSGLQRILGPFKAWWRWLVPIPALHAPVLAPDILTD